MEEVPALRPGRQLPGRVVALTQRAGSHCSALSREAATPHVNCDEIVLATSAGRDCQGLAWGKRITWGLQLSK